ncbi:IGR protein motif-domain-containing protein [Terfezia claveryi]|nr:IGR protein motif-domain-containing protein [Terfezia claveryi]
MSAFRLPTLPRLIFSSAPPLHRTVHHSLPLPPVPPVTNAIPNSATFLKLIGRGAFVHATKLASWESLFKSTSAQLKEAGVEPARLRKYIISQRERYRVAGGKIEVKEVKRGVKKDGGERRRKMIRAVRGTEEYREKRRQEEKEAEAGLAV